LPADVYASDSTGSSDMPESTEKTMKWYVLHTYAGQEDAVREALEQRIRAYSLQDKVRQVLVPRQKVIEIRDGKRVETERKLFPGYILIEADLDDERTWQIIRTTPRVAGVISAGRRPMPLTDEEVQRIFDQIREAEEKPVTELEFERGETVQIIDGPFTGFVGQIEDINYQKQTLRVVVTIFSRATPLELSFLQVKKLQ
jgi:transcriptional antiterminator NusG